VFLKIPQQKLFYIDMIRRMPVYFSGRPFTRRSQNQVIASARRAATMPAEQQLAELERLLRLL
jgi:hypothetical protein